MDIAQLITTSREQAGLTQARLAAQAGTSQATLSKYESGEAMPTIATLERLLAASGSTLKLSSERSPRQLDIRRGRMRFLRENRREIIAILNQNHAYNPEVFGSVARGDDSEASDIDLLIDFDVKKQGLLPLAHIADTLSEKFHQQFDLVPRSVIAEHVASHAMKEVVPL